MRMASRRLVDESQLRQIEGVAAVQVSVAPCSTGRTVMQLTVDTSGMGVSLAHGMQVRLRDLSWRR